MPTQPPKLASFRHPITPWQAEAVAARRRLDAYLDRVDRLSREPRLLREAS